MKHLIVFFTCFLGALSSAIAQEKSSLTFSFEQDTVMAEPGNTFINFLVLKNESKISIQINKIVPQTAYPGTLLSPTASSFFLAAGDSKRFPIKFIANPEFLRISEKSIQYLLSYTEDELNKVQSANFYINRKEDNNLSIYSFSAENYLDPNLSENTVSFFVENRSYSNRQIKLSYRLQPDGLELSQKDVIINLEAREKKLIDLKVSSRSKNGFNPDYQIIINAEDLALNKVVGSTSLKVLMLSSSRQMNATGSNILDNSIEFTQNQMNQGFAYSQLKANSIFAVNGLQASFSSNVDYYAQNNNINIYNTWFEIGSQSLALRLGNIYGESYDYSISGKGAKLIYKPNDNHNFEIIGSENDYSIYNNLNTSRELARTLASRYEFIVNKSARTAIAYVYNTDPNTSINTNLLTLSSAITVDSIQNLRFEGGISKQRNTSVDLQAFGYSTGIYYGMNSEKWRISSNNFYSTPEYAGQKRGTLNLNQSVSYTISQNKQLFLRYSNTTNQPHYLAETRSFDLTGKILPTNYYGRNQSFGTGLSINYNGINLSISPQVSEQKSIISTMSKEMLSYSLQMDVGTAFGEHKLNFSTEYGTVKVNKKDGWNENLRLLLSYRYKNISLNALVHLNAQNIYEINQSSNKSNNYSLYSSYSFKAFNENLKVNLSSGLNYSGIYQSFNKNINASIEYKLANTWAITSSNNFSGFQTSSFSSNNSQFKVGIKKYFRQATSIGNHTVKLKIFQDDNYNGILDAKEKALSSEIIRLNSSVALTDKNGEVSYQNVMPGKYRIGVNGVKGLQLNGIDSIVVNRNRTLLLPMIQKIQVSGELKEIKQQYDTKESDIVGVNIYARNEKGEIFNTFVNPQGNFDFYLIEGNYTIYIENTRYEFVNPSQTVQAIRGETPHKLLFEFKKKDTEIKVKKF